jgi:hypothetical protein
LGDGRPVAFHHRSLPNSELVVSEDSAMDRRPTPVCKCFLLCRQIFVDTIRQDYTLVCPVHQVFASRYPLSEDVSVFARWSNAHGDYAVEVQLRSLDGDVLWRQRMEHSFEAHDPLQVWTVALPHLTISIPEPGKYEVVLLANGLEVASDVFLAHRVQSARASGQ